MSLNCYNHIEHLIDASYTDLQCFFNNSDCVSKTKLESKIIQSNISGRKYLKIFLKEDVLNERDVDLIDIELNYTIQENNINITGELYGSDGKIFIEFNYEVLKEEILDIKNKLYAFVCTVKKEWTAIVNQYIIYY